MTSIIDIANEEVSIIGLLRSLDVLVPDLMPGKSYKTYCPFGMQHSDYGAEKTLRVYPDTNSAYCFGGCGHFTPAWLASVARDVPVQQAAADLLEEINYRLPTATTWTSPPEPAPDRSALAEALRVWCMAPPRQVELDNRAVSTTMDRCLALLEFVATTASAESWLLSSKKVMQASLERNFDRV